MTMALFWQKIINTNASINNAYSNRPEPIYEQIDLHKTKNISDETSKATGKKKLW